MYPRRVRRYHQVLLFYSARASQRSGTEMHACGASLCNRTGRSAASWTPHGRCCGRASQ